MSTDPSELRSRLDHPVIDADGHTVEFLPALIPYFRKAGIADDLDAFFAHALDIGTGLWEALSPAERARHRTVRPSWWAIPTRNTLDYATASLPGLMHERLPSLGIDFAVVYPSLGLILPHIADGAVRRGACRAVNQFHADAFDGTDDRLAPVAVVPMHSPDEAIAELEYAVLTLGFKAVMIASFVTRPVEAVAELAPAARHQATWIDTYGLDSAADYDPFWARCLDLGVSLAAHSGAMGWDGRRSTSSYMYNHIGHFGTASEALCKSLVFGGVTARFPELRVAFLEGGVNWGCRLFADLVGHWEKRNRGAIQNYNPAHLDRDVFEELLASHGGRLLEATDGPDLHELAFGTPAGQAEPDDEFAGCEVQRIEDFVARFADCFVFGCEADDPLVGQAFDEGALPCDARLRALFSSDIGHWDVPDMTAVLGEAHELVDHGHLDAHQFRDFTFANTARFYTDTNPGFFAGTSVDAAVRELLAEG